MYLYIHHMIYSVCNVYILCIWYYVHLTMAFQAKREKVNFVAHQNDLDSARHVNTNERSARYQRPTCLFPWFCTEILPSSPFAQAPRAFTTLPWAVEAKTCPSLGFCQLRTTRFHQLRLPKNCESTTGATAVDASGDVLTWTAPSESGRGRTSGCYLIWIQSWCSYAWQREWAVRKWMNTFCKGIKC